MLQEYCRLTILFRDGSQTMLVGEEEEFRWVIAQYCSEETVKKVEVAGKTEFTTDGVPMTVAIALEDVVEITLEKLYG